MNYHEITITTDTNFPADGDDVVRIGRLNGRKVAGWWTTSELHRWITSRDGSIVADDGGTMVVVARLTKKEAK